MVSDQNLSSDYAAKFSKKNKTAAHKNIASLTKSQPRPFVKWVGGKRQLLDILHAGAPQCFGRYFEPFVGGGALLFSLLPQKATIADANSELINCYTIIRDDVEALISSLQTHKNEASYFYTIRGKSLAELTPVQRASRFIYLNKTCFNGLYRENSRGQFNTPFGRYLNPTLVDKDNLLSINHYLQNADIKIHCADYQSVLDEAQPGDLVYFDPPYAPLTKTARFSNYIRDGFNVDDQKKLADVFTELSCKEVLVILSNSNTSVIHSLYRGFNIQVVHATRSINCKGSKRGRVANEVLIKNF